MLVIINNGTLISRVAVAIFIAIFTASTAFAEARSPGGFVVTADSLNVRLAANETGKVTDKLFQREKVEVFEVRNGWARVSEYYDEDVSGISTKVARWVFATHLSAQRPANMKVIASAPIVEAIKSSDDLVMHQDTFVWVSDKLVKAGECKLSDFEDIGGWWRSVDHKPRPVYYTYCGGAVNNHRVYVNTATGETFR
jgi:uncharacterized protein YgiM (DUF1202 family)